jgi:hypothetical protein
MGILLVGAPRFELGTPSPPGLRAGNDLVLCQHGLHRFQLAYPGESPGVLVTALCQPLQRRRLVGLGDVRIGLADGGYA